MIDSIQSRTVPTAAYDPAGNLQALVAPFGNVTYAYDALNRLQSVTSPQNGKTTYTYDLGGRRTRVLYPNKIQAAYAYDKANRLLSVVHTSLTNPNLRLPKFSYLYDKVGNRTQMIDNEGTHAYTYDSLYRLSSVVYPLGTKQEYTYDAVGNRLTLKKGSTVTNYSYDAGNRLLSAGNITFQYDPNGNPTKEINPITGTRVYSYDFENRLKTQGPSTNPFQNRFTYDGLGRRVEKTTLQGTTRFYHDGFDVSFETTSQDTLKTYYLHGPRIDEIISSKQGILPELFYLADGLGSTAGLITLQGILLSSYSYDVFGALRRQTGLLTNNYLFTGRELDRETALYYYRNRYYNPSVGRFITKDPIGLRGGINPYRYVRNNPTNYIDPFGLTDSSDVDDALYAAEKYLEAADALPPGMDVVKDLILGAIQDKGPCEITGNIGGGIAGAMIGTAAGSFVVTEVPVAPFVGGAVLGYYGSRFGGDFGKRFDRLIGIKNYKRSR